LRPNDLWIAFIALFGFTMCVFLLVVWVLTG